MVVPTSQPLPFGEWLPDLGNYNNPGALTVLNCVPQADRYKPFAEPMESTDALPDKCIGRFKYRDADGNTITFAGTATGIYRLDGTSWVDVTRLNGAGPAKLPYTGSADTFWVFLNFGNLIIATNYNDDIQCFDTSADTNFSRMSATAPRCRHMAILNNYLVCVDIEDSDGTTPFRVRWGPIANPKGDWTVAPTTTGADFQDIYGGDYSNVFVGDMGDYGIIVQGKALWRMDYVGGTDIFDIHKIEGGRGSLLTRSCIINVGVLYFLDEDGFYSYNGTTEASIGQDKIDKYFYSQFDENYDYNLNCEVDPLRKNILWSMPDKSANGGLPNYFYCFNWSSNRWTLIQQECEILFSFLTSGYTMESLSVLYPDLDTLPYSLDSRIWSGGKTVLGCFTSNHKLAAFAGQNKTATIGTMEVRINDNGESLLRSLIPYVEGGTITARAGYRNIINEDVQWTPFIAQNSVTGECDILKRGVYHRAEFQISDDWSIATAFAVRSPNIVNSNVTIADGAA